MLFKLNKEIYHNDFKKFTALCQYSMTTLLLMIYSNFDCPTNVTLKPPGRIKVFS